MSPEDWLILGTAGIIGVNRVFAGTGALRLSRFAYVCVQLVDLSACVALTFVHVLPSEPRFDLMVRLFLLLMVAWHMVHNSRARGLALSQVERDDDLEAQRALIKQRIIEEMEAQSRARRASPEGPAAIGPGAGEDDLPDSADIEPR